VEHVLADLGGKIDLILDGGMTQVGVESTVLDLTCSPPSKLRPGGVSRESLTRILGNVSVSSGKGGEVLKSPGQLKQHYAPRAKVLLFAGKHREKVIQTMRERMAQLKKEGGIGIMVPEEELTHFTDTDAIVIGLSSFATMEQVAKELFTTIRALDNRGVNYIFALAPPKEGIGLAVFDRLFKASGSQLIEVD
jgi:L-threonylcarbamoyladenylate synthase